MDVMDEEYRIVVVDDDVSNLKIAGSILSDNGMRVTAFGSGRTLLEQIENGLCPDLILLDVLMPNMDGFETLSRLRQFENSRNKKPVPVAFLTAEENSDTREKAVALGAVDILRKPLDPGVLVSRVESVLSGNSGYYPQTPDETEEVNEISEDLQLNELHKQSLIFDERGVDHGAYLPERDGFAMIYRYMLRHITRYGGNILKVLVTVRPTVTLTEREMESLTGSFLRTMSGVLRNSDVILSIRPDKFFMLLPMVTGTDLSGIIDRVEAAWRKEPGNNELAFSYVSENEGAVREKRPEVNGLDYRYAQLNLPTDKMLNDTLNDFAASMPARLERLGKSFAAIDTAEGMTAYRIEVHAMKSSSAMVGFMQLSGLARLLEGYARNSEADKIRALHPLFAEEWERSYYDLGEALGLDTVKKEKSDGSRILPDILELLRVSIDNLDTEGVSRALEKISSYTYDEKTASAIEKLKRAAIEFDDSAFDIIKELQQ